MDNMKVVIFLFKILCVVLFFYQACICLIQYLDQDSVSVRTHGKQEDYPRPQICVALTDIRTTNLSLPTNNEYKKFGKWTTNTFDANELYDLLSPSFPDIVDLITIRKLLTPISGEYTIVKIPTDTENLEDHGIMIERKDYYYYLKTYCILLRYTSFHFLLFYSLNFCLFQTSQS